MNKRVHGAKLLESNEEIHKNIIAKLKSCQLENDIEVRQFVPKNDTLFSSEAFEVCHVSEDKRQADFCSFVFDDKQHPHIPFDYRLLLEAHPSPVYGDGNEQQIGWMRDVAFKHLLRWLANITVDGKASIKSHQLIQIDNYVKTYRNIKENFGKSIVLELWRSKNIEPKCFCDIGCGNGLLVHLLTTQKFTGYGIDLRRRNIWSNFEGTDLRELSLNPEVDTVQEGDFLIGNHSDELTPWIAILAARSRCNFFLLPCCPFDFYGRYQKKMKGISGDSCYGSYLVYLRSICERLGYRIEEDRLKIPSTKRRCLIGLLPKDGLPTNLDEIIEFILGEKKSNGFIARSKVEKVSFAEYFSSVMTLIINTVNVTNCSQLPRDVRHSLTMKIFDYLFNLDGETSSTPSCNEWHRGGIASLLQVTQILNDSDKQYLKNSDGGIQTFLKNQHQVFKVHSYNFNYFENIKGNESFRIPRCFSY
ncbi:unnamed protein product [Anisakis simplex]|uniref:tRNA (uracil-O(2)-)-methyltransferase n=1 Tax=Anisakis simplex TaxID=6269 RepID=A0A0M3JUF6_ANISI|nr:unnamed protein product [Anisakis simplex]